MAAKKNDPQATVENGKLVASNADQSAQERLAELQAERRKLETELAEINGKFRSAIDTGDVELLSALSARKTELPGLFIAASVAETSARHDVFKVEDEANLQVLQAAEAERDEIQAALQKAQAESEAKLALLREQAHAAEGRVNAVYSSISASRDRGAVADEGFKKSLAALTGI